MVDWQTLSLSVYQYRSVQGFHSMAYQCYKVFAVQYILVWMHHQLFHKQWCKWPKKQEREATL